MIYQKIISQRPLGDHDSKLGKVNSSDYSNWKYSEYRGFTSRIADLSTRRIFIREKKVRSVSGDSGRKFEQVAPIFSSSGTRLKIGPIVFIAPPMYTRGISQEEKGFDNGQSFAEIMLREEITPVSISIERVLLPETMKNFSTGIV